MKNTDLSEKQTIMTNEKLFVHLIIMIMIMMANTPETKPPHENVYEQREIKGKIVIIIIKKMAKNKLDISLL